MLMAISQEFNQRQVRFRRIEKYMEVLRKNPRVRSFLSQISRGLVQFGYMFQGQINLQETERYFEEGGPPNVELAK